MRVASSRTYLEERVHVLLLSLLTRHAFDLVPGIPVIC